MKQCIRKDKLCATFTTPRKGKWKHKITAGINVESSLAANKSLNYLLHHIPFFFTFFKTFKITFLQHLSHVLFERSMHH